MGSSADVSHSCDGWKRICPRRAGIPPYQGNSFAIAAPLTLKSSVEGFGGWVVFCVLCVGVGF